MNYVVSIHHCSGNLDHQKPLIPEKHSFNSSITFSQNRGRRDLYTRDAERIAQSESEQNIAGWWCLLLTYPRDTHNDQKLRRSEPKKLIGTNEISENNDINRLLSFKSLKVYACPQRRSGERVVEL
jgi:hypothetical protein